jgi:ABC-type nitrate/sulfonate/bicarbonate transport system permease component
VRTVVAFGLLLLFWAVGTHWGAIPFYVLPSPDAVVEAYQPSMLMGLAATGLRALGGVVCGVSVAYMAIFAAHLTNCVKGADDQFSAARAVPGVAAMPLFLLWFGLGEFARVLVISLTVLAFVAGPLAEATRRLPREWRIQRERLRQTRAWEYWHVTMPGTLGSMTGPLRVALAVALTTAVATDFMGSSVGIGQAIMIASVTFNTPAIFLLLLMTALLGLVLDRSVTAALRRSSHWLGQTAKG